MITRTPLFVTCIRILPVSMYLDSSATVKKCVGLGRKSFLFSSNSWKFFEQPNHTITLRHSHSIGTPLDEWSARRRYIYLQTHNTHKRQTSNPAAGFEPPTPPSKRSRDLTPSTARPLGSAVCRRMWPNIMWLPPDLYWLRFEHIQICSNVSEYITVCIFRVHLREHLMSYKKKGHKKEGKKQNDIKKKTIKANCTVRMEMKYERCKCKFLS